MSGQEPDSAGGELGELAEFLGTFSSIQNKRRVSRLDISVSVQYKVLSDGLGQSLPEIRPYLESRSRNVSPLGACLNVRERMSPGTVLALSLEFMESRHKLSAVARVIWCRPSREGGRWFHAGLEFMVMYRKAHVESHYMAPKDMEKLLESLPV
jgi:hypothetical protein